MKGKILLYGFSVFSMFFGSGNLVYPLQVGMIGGELWYYSFLGFFCTGIILPFLGLFVIKLHKGSYDDFFSEAGTIAKYALPLITLSLLGSFGVIPRCITVAHGGLEYMFDDIPLVTFSIIFCLVSYIFCIKDQYMFQIIGKFLTPILLCFLAFLIIYGINVESSPANIGDKTTQLLAFTSGFTLGYNTMDLLAAYFFSALIFKQIEAIIPAGMEQSVIKTALKPSLIGAFILAVVYLGFVYLGASYGFAAADKDPELILPAISTYLLGENGAVVIAIIIILSCLTTAVALNKIYASYLCSLFRLSEDKTPYVLIVTTLITFVISSFDFSGIAKILTPILTICYPALIALTISSILFKRKLLLKMTLFYGIIVFLIITQSI